MTASVTWIGIGLTLTLVGATGRSTTTTSSSQPSTRMTGPIVYRLSPTAYPSGVATERDYADWLDRQIVALTCREHVAPAPEMELPLVLARANLRLSRQAEPALTQLMLRDDPEANRRRLAAALVPVQADLKQAASLLARLGRSPAPNRAAAKRQERWRSEVESLTVLSDAMAALAGKGDARSCLPALQPLTMSKQADLAAAARLLQAALMRQSGKVDGGIKLLELPVIPPEQLPYDFFARLLRCRLLADRGGHAIAAAMAVQIDLRCESWFDKARRAEARRAVGLLRIDLARRWADQLERDGLADHAASRRAAAARTREQLFGKDPVVYRLGLAVPVLAATPQPPVSTTSRSVTTPAPKTTTSRSATTRRSPSRRSPETRATTAPATAPAHKP